MVSLANRIVQGLLIAVFAFVLLAAVAYSQLTYGPPSNATGTVTQVATAAPLTGGPITAAGTVSCASCAILATGTTGGAATITPVVTANGGSLYTVTALGAAAQFLAPMGTPNNGDTLLIRIKDNGTARGLTFTTTANAYRASTDLPFPTTTVASRTMYLNFMWNATDARWDFMAQLGNFQ
jgi:hypothetical protein